MNQWSSTANPATTEEKTRSITCHKTTQSASLIFPPEGLQYLIETLAAEILAHKTGIPTTTHILGGAVVADRGVVDGHGKASGYQNMLVCDGSKVPANPRVNPSLTITAMSEHAMSAIPVASH